MQNKLYLAFIICAFISTFFDVLSIILNGNNSAPIMNSILWLVNLISFVTINTLPMLYTVYVAALVNYEATHTLKEKKRLLLLVLVPYIILVVLIVFSPDLYFLTKKSGVFYIDENCCYHRGELFFFIPYLYTFYTLVCSIVLIIKNRDNIKWKKRMMLLSYIVIMVIAVCIQFIFPKYLVQCFGISLAAIMFSTILQSPDEYLDRNTDLFNQAAMLKILSKNFRSNNNFLCISVILDDITFISNTFGIEVMNRFLQEVSAFLKQNFPHAYHFYLQPGKFCLIMTNYQARDIERYVFELRARFHENWACDALDLKLYSRFCVMEAPVDVKSAEEILDLIDMISDDDRYKQTTVYAREIDTEYKKRTIVISHLLRNALAENRFQVYYQPIYSTYEDRLIGAEALIRMKNEEGKFVSPEEFIPIAEKTGDIQRIGRFVFETVCSSFSKINLAEFGIKKIDINLSVAQCMQEKMAESILTIREVYNIPSNLLNLEITETVAAHTPDILLKNMKRLENGGIELSLDDYGSGYSNMGYLLNLPFKMVKLDKNIVWAAFNDYKANIALASTISMIKKLGMKVLAEGVETEEQVRWLVSLGCDYLQGFYFDKGLPLQEYLNLMKQDQERYKRELENKNEYLRELEAVDPEEEFAETMYDSIDEVEEIENIDSSEFDNDVSEMESVSESEEDGEIEEISELDSPEELEEI